MVLTIIGLGHLALVTFCKWMPAEFTKELNLRQSR